MSSSQSNKLGQIYVEWDIKKQILRYVSAWLRGTQTAQCTHCAPGDQSCAQYDRITLSHNVRQVSTTTLHSNKRSMRH